MNSKLLLIEVLCPKCGAGLNEGDRIPLDGMVVEGGARGVVKLSAYFGEYGVETDLRISQGALVKFNCPKCEESLMISQTCELCHAPLASLELKQGGHVDFCTRRGCNAHALGGFGDVNQMIELMNKITGTPNY
jgi:predicted RNA-binding Zn-ribbon protein involved in translation (DUF1610 family)